MRNSLNILLIQICFEFWGAKVQSLLQKGENSSLLRTTNYLKHVRGAISSIFTSTFGFKLPKTHKAEHQQSISRLPTKGARENTGYGTPNMFFVCLFLKQNSEKQEKISKICLLQIAIFQLWINEFSITPRQQCRKGLGLISSLIRKDWYY